MNTLTEIPESYQDTKKRHADELNAFEGIFFAFSEEQFKEGLAKVGLNPDQTGKLFKLAGGGFILRDRAEAFADMFKRHDAEMKACRKNRKFLLESIVYELINHEYCITYNAQDALDALGIKREDLPQGLLKQASKIALERSNQP